jgi:hypothetical protein
MLLVSTKYCTVHEEKDQAAPPTLMHHCLRTWARGLTLGRRVVSNDSSTSGKRTGQWPSSRRGFDPRVPHVAFKEGGPKALFLKKARAEIGKRGRKGNAYLLGNWKDREARRGGSESTRNNGTRIRTRAGRSHCWFDLLLAPLFLPLSATAPSSESFVRSVLALVYPADDRHGGARRRPHTAPSHLARAPQLPHHGTGCHVCEARGGQQQGREREREARRWERDPRASHNANLTIFLLCYM